MSDDNASPSRTERRERALAAARRRLKRLEIETHRIKAELARLEAENEDDIADELSGELVGDAAIDASTEAAAGSSTPGRVRRPGGLPRDPNGGSTDRSPVSDPSLETRSWGADRTPRLRRRPAKRPSPIGPRIQIDTQHDPAGAPAGSRALARKARRQTMPALWSLGLHTAVLLLCLPWTFAVLTNDDVPLMASSLDLTVEPLDDVTETSIELADDLEFQLQDVAVGETALDLAGSLTGDLTPLEDTSAAELASTIGQLDSLPSDLGTLMAGAGRDGDGGGRGRARGRGGRRGTNFFGAEAIGDRIVFLVDNSGSMKQGRMETTVYELLRSVDAMTDEQSFYVIFYSDQAYPMFYPNGVDRAVPATREYKQKLLAWLRTVELCIGGQLVKAMDLAASLRPDVVYILSDGDISSVRTMQRLTEPNDWEFVIHTLGMGVKSAEHAANLATISGAHRGSFRMVQPTPAAVQMARRQPIHSNPSGVAWGMGLPQRRP